MTSPAGHCEVLRGNVSALLPIAAPARTSWGARRSLPASRRGPPGRPPMARAHRADRPHRRRRAL